MSDGPDIGAANGTDPILIAVEVGAAVQEATAFADAVAADGRFRPVLVIAGAASGSAPEFRNSMSYETVVSNAVAPPGPRAARRWGKRVLPFGVTEFLATWGRLGAAIRRARHLLDRYHPAAVVVLDDRRLGLAAGLLREARRRGTATMVLPFALSNPESDAVNRLGRYDLVLGRRPYTRLKVRLARRFPASVFRFQDRDLLFFSPPVMLALAMRRISLPRPWTYGGGGADRVAVFGPGDARRLIAAGVASWRIAVTGQVGFDALARNAAGRDGVRAALCRRYGFDPTKPLAICAVPALLEQAIGDTDRQVRNTERLFKILAACPASVALSLHPRQSLDDYAQLAARHGLAILQDSLRDSLAAADVFVAYSSTIRWAAALGIPTIALECLGIGFETFGDWDGVTVVRDWDRLRPSIEELIAGEGTDQPRRMRDPATDHGPLDGRAGTRIIDDIEAHIGTGRAGSAPTAAPAQKARQHALILCEGPAPTRELTYVAGAMVEDGRIMPVLVTRGESTLAEIPDDLLATVPVIRVDYPPPGGTALALRLWTSRALAGLLVPLVGNDLPNILRRLDHGTRWAKVLFETFDPVAVLTHNDRSVGLGPPFFKEAAARRRLSMAVPFALSSPESDVSNRLDRRDTHSGTPPYRLAKALIARWFPDQFRETPHGRLMFLSPGIFTALLFRRMLLERPWTYGGGRTDRVGVIGASDRRKLEAVGIAPEKILVTGQPSLDRLWTSGEARAERRANLATRYGFPASRPLVIFAMPSLYEQERGDRERNRAITEALTATLGRTDATVLISLHPRQARADYAAAAAAGGMIIADQPLVEILPTADVFVAYSSTIHWAAMLGIPTIAVSCFDLDYEPFENVDGIDVVRDVDTLPETISRLLDDSAYRAERISLLHRAGCDLGLVDGQASSRVIDAIVAAARPGLETRPARAETKAGIGRATGRTADDTSSSGGAHP